MQHYIGGRFWVKLISSKAFAQYVQHRGFTARSLATAVDKELKKMKAMRGDKPAGCSRSLVGHLMSGHRNTCLPHTARAIERVLDAPEGSLFVPQVLPVVRNSAA
jgi:hypothetical protein